MTNLEYAICEAENRGEISIDDRDTMLSYISEKFGIKDSIKAVKSKLDTAKSMNAGRAALKNGVEQSKSDRIKGLKAANKVEKEIIASDAAYVIEVYTKHATALYRKHTKSAVKNAAAAENAKNSYIVDEGALNADLEKLDKVTNEQLAKLNAKADAVDAATKGMMEATIQRYKRAHNQFVHDVIDNIKFGFRHPLLTLQSIFPILQKIAKAKPAEAAKVQDAKNAVEDAAKQPVVPEGAEVKTDGSGEAKNENESVDALRMEIYDAELSGQITVEERMSLIDELDAKLAMESTSDTHDDIDDAFAYLL